MMIKEITTLIILSFFVVMTCHAQNGKDKKNSDNAKILSGISIIGNKDAPKSLYIVPWRGSELEMETDLNASLLNEGLHAVDKDVFLRELDFYESTKNK